MSATQPSLMFGRTRERKRDQLRDALLTGRKMSKQEILRELGIWNSGDQVMKLRREGLNIKTEMIERGENRFAVYFIPQS